MLDKFDYAEPACPLCDGKEFYYPSSDAPRGSVPVDRILARADALFGKNDYPAAGRLLEGWQREAVELCDKRGELAILSELVGYYRKQEEKEKGLAAVERALTLTEQLGQSTLASGGTVFLNCATACQAFGDSERALSLYQRAKTVYGATLDATDARFGGLYNNMALAQSALGRFDEAEASFYCALSVMERIPHGEGECAVTYVNLAHLYEDTGRLEKIDECLERALALLKTEGLPHGGGYAFLLEKCAPSFRYFGFPSVGEALEEEARRIYAGA